MTGEMMHMIPTDYGMVPVRGNISADLLKPGGALHAELVALLEQTFQFYPVIEFVEIVDGRIGLWQDGEARKCIRMRATIDFSSPTDALVSP